MGPQQVCMREIRKNSFSIQQAFLKQINKIAQYSAQHPSLGTYCRRNLTTRCAAGRILTNPKTLEKPSDYWNRTPLLCEVEPQYSFRLFIGIGSPRKD
ncbi:hypothetical protein AVEN_200289-1 [Araneus ventricosus]|uniref:Uncharacterized protein n=1 Tax=Araneus ventricosus TaxID=182803 RepID=A0A4Y2HHS9_ARAVE|nr:hypothetical protein AVEN_200289-1 [Araneus ventricosus]